MILSTEKLCYKRNTYIQRLFTLCSYNTYIHQTLALHGLLLVDEYFIKGLH